VLVVAAPVGVGAREPDRVRPAATDDASARTYVTAEKDGRVLVSIARGREQEISVDQLDTVLRRTSEGGRQTVILRADPQVKYREFMEVIDQMQRCSCGRWLLISEEVRP
jgi:biopolymer transport protein ExbD